LRFAVAIQILNTLEQGTSYACWVAKREKIATNLIPERLSAKQNLQQDSGRWDTIFPDLMNSRVTPRAHDKNLTFLPLCLASIPLPAPCNSFNHGNSWHFSLFQLLVTPPTLAIHGIFSCCLPYGNRPFSSSPN
jgi:hypothetical protein